MEEERHGERGVGYVRRVGKEETEREGEMEGGRDGGRKGVLD